MKFVIGLLFALMLAITIVSAMAVDTTSSNSGFCGVSAKDYCDTDTDCITSGCNSEICGTKEYLSEISSICIAKECFNDEAYGMSCGCVNNKCEWRKNIDPTPEPKVCCHIYGIGSMGVPTEGKYEETLKEECVVPEGFVGGGREIVDMKYCLNEEEPTVCCQIGGTTDGLEYKYRYEKMTKSKCSNTMAVDDEVSASIAGVTYAVVDDEFCEVKPMPEEDIFRELNTYIVMSVDEYVVIKGENLLLTFEEILYTDVESNDQTNSLKVISPTGQVIAPTTTSSNVKPSPYSDDAIVVESPSLSAKFLVQNYVVSSNNPGFRETIYLTAGEKVEFKDYIIKTYKLTDEKIMFMIVKVSTDNTKPVPSEDIEIFIEESISTYTKPVTIRSSTQVQAAIQEQEGVEVSEDWKIIDDNAFQARTREVVVQNIEGFALETLDGQVLIKILPSEAAEQAREATRNVVFGDIELIEENGKATYELRATHRMRILGFIPATGDFSAKVDAQSGKVIEADKPWFSFISTIKD